MSSLLSQSIILLGFLWTAGSHTAHAQNEGREHVEDVQPDPPVTRFALSAEPQYMRYQFDERPQPGFRFEPIQWGFNIAFNHHFSINESGWVLGEDLGLYPIAYGEGESQGQVMWGHGALTLRIAYGFTLSERFYLAPYSKIGL
jgi:hypothetical protein